MARKFLYLIAGLILAGAALLFAMRIWGQDLTRVALIPSAAFEEQAPLAGNAYADPRMWLSHPRFRRDTDPARWLPPGIEPGPELPVAVFFVHPTSYLERTRWNAALDDAQSQSRARTFVRGLASPFNGAAQLWAPRYRQATFGAFLTDAPEGAQALDAAYADVAQAFDLFLAEAEPGRPIVLAGHSQGALHVLRLLRERVAGTPVAGRIAAVYAIGWPISVAHDLPALPLPACATPGRAAASSAGPASRNPPIPACCWTAMPCRPGSTGRAAATARSCAPIR